MKDWVDEVQGWVDSLEQENERIKQEIIYLQTLPQTKEIEEKIERLWEDVSANSADIYDYKSRIRRALSED